MIEKNILIQKTRKCRICEIIYPLTSEFFHKNKPSKDHFLNACKKCVNIINKDRVYNGIHHREYMKIWRKKNREKVKQHNIKNRKKRAKYNKEWFKRQTCVEGISYKYIHDLVNKIKKKPDYCEICNEYNLEIELAFDHTKKIYTKNPEDYIYCCNKCHKLYDKTIKKGGKL